MEAAKCSHRQFIIRGQNRVKFDALFQKLIHCLVGAMRCIMLNGDEKFLIQSAARFVCGSAGTFHTHRPHTIAFRDIQKTYLTMTGLEQFFICDLAAERGIVHYCVNAVDLQRRSYKNRWHLDILDVFQLTELIESTNKDRSIYSAFA